MRKPGSLRFADRVVVVTGSSSGIGLATTRQFIDGGARVVGFDLQPPAEQAEGLRWVEADVSEFDTVGDCVSNVLEAEGSIDCLINNAGISRDATVWSMTEPQWDSVLGVNLKGAFNLIHHVAPHLRERRGGKIVNVSSINGLRGKFGLANYSAAKAGLIGLTKTVAKELGRYGVNVNAVAPGMVLTPLVEELPARFLDEARTETVLGRLATVDDVASVILFLCSDAARHVTGEVIRVDGGQTI